MTTLTRFADSKSGDGKTALAVVEPYWWPTGIGGGVCGVLGKTKKVKKNRTPQKREKLWKSVSFDDESDNKGGT